MRWGGTHKKPGKEWRWLENQAGVVSWEPVEEGVIRWGDRASAQMLLQGQVLRTECGHWPSTREVIGDVGKRSFGGAVGPKPDWSGSKGEEEGRDG